jgi:1-acyl-sn-glycerol-3-phosphate acyltransferase
VREFRRGAAILSNRLEVPVLPTGIWGTHQAWPRQGKKRRHPVAVQFGEPLEAARQGDDALLDALRDRVVTLVREAEDIYEAPTE